jgi:ferritin
MDDVLKMNIAEMVNDLKKVFTTEEEFQALSDVLTESLGEFLQELVFETAEEDMNVETLLDRLKEIITRRFNEI